MDRKPFYPKCDLDTVVITLEGASPDEVGTDNDDGTYVVGIRHKECLERTDCFNALFLRFWDEALDPYEGHYHECWGCEGWLDEPPLTLEETARRHRLWEAEMDYDDAWRRGQNPGDWQDWLRERGLA